MEAFNPTMPQLEIPLKQMVSKEDCLSAQPELRHSDEEVVDLSYLDDTMLPSGGGATGGGASHTTETHPQLQYEFAFEEVYNNSAAAGGALTVVDEQSCVHCGRCVDC